MVLLLSKHCVVIHVYSQKMYLVDQLDFFRQEKNQVPLPLASKF